MVLGWKVTHGTPSMFSVLRSDCVYNKSPCTTPSIPSLLNSLSAILNLTAKSPLISSLISLSVLYNLGVLLNTPFLATKNCPSDGSTPANMAGAPSHFVVKLTGAEALPDNISRIARK